MKTKERKPWEFIAVDLIYQGRDPVTVALLPSDIPDLDQWIRQNVKRPLLGQTCFVFTSDVTLH